MGESAIVVCELSVAGAKALERADGARDWLLTRGIIEPNYSRDALWQPSAFRAGARAIEVAPELADATACARANNGVDIVRDRAVHHPVENGTPPTCPACGSVGNDITSLLVAWLEGDEPPVVCPGCSNRYLLGDAAGRFNAYVSEIAVRFNNWPPLTAAFLDELGRVLGPRPRVVYVLT
jgi:hypothetical protein